MNMWKGVIKICVHLLFAKNLLLMKVTSDLNYTEAEMQKLNKSNDRC